MKRRLQKAGDAVSKPLNVLGRVSSEALDSAEEKLMFLPFGVGWTTITIPVVDGVRFVYSCEQAGALTATQKVGLEESGIERPQPG